MKELSTIFEAPATQERRPVTGAGWGQERRLEFIEFRLLWEGKINRGELVTFFGTSIQQASLDLARYMELAPGNLEYDRSEKVYKARENLNLIFIQRDSQTFLSQLSGPSSGPASTPPSFVGWRPPYDLVKYPTRSIRPEILMRVIWAIRDRQDVELLYQSMRRPAATRRWISPHAIAFDGSRWHVRAWCHDNKYFKDFVFARIQQIYGVRTSEVDGREDKRWHSFTSVILRASSNLTQRQRIAVETEFGMRDGILEVQMREALVYYFVRQLRLDRNTRSSREGPLEWVNARDLEPLVTEASSR
jgi:hypothetical protein